MSLDDEATSGTLRHRISFGYYNSAGTFTWKFNSAYANSANMIIQEIDALSVLTDGYSNCLRYDWAPGTTGTVVVNQGDTLTIELEGMRNYYMTTSDVMYSFDKSGVFNVVGGAYDANWTWHDLEPVDYEIISYTDGKYDIYVTFPEAELDYIEFYLYVYYIDEAYGVLSGSLGSLWISTGNETFTHDADANTGINRSILDRVKDIAAGITQLPSKIVNGIKDGLKDLFIPSEDDVSSMRDKFDSLMADRFGAIYEAGSIIADYAGNMTEQAEKETIEVPELTVNLADSDFTFGGYEVEVVPERFDFLVTILKGVLDIICTFAFIGGMRKRYDSVMGG